MDPVLSVMALSILLGGLIAVLLVGNYFRKTRSEVQSIVKPVNPANQKPSKPPQTISKKPLSKFHAHSTDKGENKRHHPLDVNTLKGHGDSVTGVCFFSDGRSLATACADGVIRVFKIDDASSKSFKFLRINVPLGGHPTAVAFSDDASLLVVASQTLSGSSLYMFGDEKIKNADDTKQPSKPPLPEIKWEHHQVHEKLAIITLAGAIASYGTADGSTVIASCSEGTDIKLWHGRTGKFLGSADTNQLKNTMAAISSNGRFIAAAAFTADVKVWEILYSKDGSVKEVSKVMQLKGHKSAVTWLCFTPDSEQIVTASKDGSIRIWNINVRYHLDEDPKCIKVFPIPIEAASGAHLHYDRLAISPDGKILAVTHGSTLQWLYVESGKVLDTSDRAHEGEITAISWTPRPISIGGRQSLVLATAGADKKVKLWEAPSVHPS